MRGLASRASGSICSATWSRAERPLDQNPDQDPDLVRLGSQLADCVIAAVPDWIARVIEGRFGDWTRASAAVGEGDPEAQSEIERLAHDAGVQARDAVAAPLRAMLSADIDDQRTTPLALVRPLVAFATAVLSEAGVPPVVRDEFAESRFPDDEYGLTPASLAVLGDEVGEMALVWGAAKAMAHRRRHER